MKYIILIILSSWISNINGVEYNCNYNTLLSGYYCCAATSGIISIESDAVVTAISGTHMENKSNNDVECIDTRGLRTSFFPQKLNTFFPNILIIFFENGMHEIHKEDLQQFPKLLFAYLSYNKFEFLEKDLFKYNPDLILIFFDSNNIKYVDPNVFDHLTRLSNLALNENICFSGAAHQSRTETLNLIESIQDSCRTPIIDVNKKNEELESINTELERKINNLENEIKNLETANEKLMQEYIFVSDKLANECNK